MSTILAHHILCIYSHPTAGGGWCLESGRARSANISPLLKPSAELGHDEESRCIVLSLEDEAGLSRIRRCLRGCMGPGAA